MNEEAGFEMSEEERVLREEIANEVFFETATDSQEEIPLEREEDKIPLGEKEEKKESQAGEEKQESQEDAWAGVSPALRKTIEDINTRLGDIGVVHNRLKQAENRIGGLTNRLRDIKINPDEKKPTKQEIDNALANDEGWEDFKQDFPSHAQAIENRVSKLTGGAVNAEVLAAMRAELQTDFDQKLNKQQLANEVKILKMRYPNHKQLISEPEFKTWLGTQPIEVKEKFSSWDALDGIDVLDRYTDYKGGKSNVENIAESRQRRLQSAAADTRKRVPPRKVKAEADMNDDEYREHLAKEIWG